MQKADIARRLVAAVLDYFVWNFVSGILFVPFWCVMFSMAAFTEGQTELSLFAGVTLSFTLCVLVLLMLAAAYFYYIWLPAKKWHGATVGKRVMAIRVVRTSGSEVTQVDLIVRETIGKFISGLVFYLGFIWILIDDRRQGWHDKLADTWVVSDDRD